MRIRRKFAFILSAFSIIVFLFLYLLINFLVPADKQTNLRNIENKLKQLENGFYEHHAEMGKLKKQIATIRQKPEESQVHQSKQLNPKSSLDRKEMFKEMFINVETNQQCSITIDTVPKADIQMLEVYKDLPFDNPDGGVWKQGWMIKYDPLQFNKHHKLKVFIVPHSHNDPGWIKTFDEYYEHDTKQILSNMLRHLNEDPEMKFIWAEISYFSKWFESLSHTSKESVKNLIKRNQLEIVTGGWVMTDEANAHWLSILMQLTEGQHWLKKHVNVTPISSWSIDPFGLSPSLPYILKGSGFQNLLIQRAHYSIKKRLAQRKELEFRWRQIWDNEGKTDLFTHLMPFYSYDVPHTCGPDPKVCCQFDFKRLPGFGLNCPWRVAPQQIDDFNVGKRAELIIDQWRKKSVLYKTRSVLIPLGDDFRFSQSTEWEAQRNNYEKLFDYINNEPSLFTEVKFSTLSEYFNAVHKEKHLEEFPSLSGDFFTYADRDDHYWSGYYTSRPYHKRMDRVLLHYIRSAEMLYAWNSWEDTEEFNLLLEDARRQLSLFQHHDGITGTAKTHVVLDYANRMIRAIRNCKRVMQQAVYRLLTMPNIYAPDYKFTYFNIDDSRWPDLEDGRTPIILGDELPTKYVVFHNSLPQWREELVELHVSSPFVKVTDFNMKKIESQIAPVWTWHKGFTSITSPQASTTKYRLLFNVKISPIGLATYIIHSTNPNDKETGTKYSKITIHTDSPFSISLGDYPLQVEFGKPLENSIRVGSGPTCTFNPYGLLKSISLVEGSDSLPIRVEFLKYGVRRNGGVSGAYLFLPDGPATQLMLGAPTVLVSEGFLESSISTGFPFATHNTILRGEAIEIRNLVDIGNMGNTEVVMRISSIIENDDIFYTDLNGMQIIKRKRFSKLPLQANYYPIPSSIYIEDDDLRLTLLTAQPLGGSALKPGQIEIMQDRRLDQDDERGLGQGILDNQPVLHIFKILLERKENCVKRPLEHPSGFLTVKAHNELQTLLHPVDKFIWNENDWNGVQGSFGNDHEPFENGFEIGVLRTLTDNKNKQNIGLVISRPYLEDCISNQHSEGSINIKKLLELTEQSEIYSSNLTLLKSAERLSSDLLTFCPMDIKGFIIKR